MGIDFTCSKCGGRLQQASDDYGPFVRCLCCGKHWDLLQPSPEVLAVLAANRASKGTWAVTKGSHDRPDGRRDDWGRFLREAKAGI